MKIMLGRIVCCISGIHCRYVLSTEGKLKVEINRQKFLHLFLKSRGFDFSEDLKSYVIFGIDLKYYNLENSKKKNNMIDKLKGISQNFD